jgi:hypothetical protein
MFTVQTTGSAHARNPVTATAVRRAAPGRGGRVVPDVVEVHEEVDVEVMV